MSNAPVTTPEGQKQSGRYKTPPGMRNIRVLVPEETFILLHDVANQSRMRMQPYLRRYLHQAQPFPSPPSDGDPVTFSCDRANTP